MFVVCLIAPAAVVAQKSSAPSRPNPGEREPRPWRDAERMADDVRMRKTVDAPILKTAKFKEAIRNYQPDKQAHLLATWGEFVTADGTEFVALQIAPAAGTFMKADAAVVAFGEFVDPSGRSELTFEEPLPVRQSKDDVFVERSFVLPAQNLIGTFGLAIGGEIIGLTRAEFNQEPLTGLTSGVSRLILSDNVYTLPAAQKPLDPFAFGGTKVVPKPGATFHKNDEVWIFTEVRNPGVDAGKLPHVMTRIELIGNGKKIAGPATPADASPLKWARRSTSVASQPATTRCATQ